MRDVLTFGYSVYIYIYIYTDECLTNAESMKPRVTIIYKEYIIIIIINKYINLIYIYLLFLLFNSSVTDIEPSLYYTALCSTQTHKVI